MPDDIEGFVKLLTGERSPADSREQAWVEFMGGVRGPLAQWERKWTTCTECGSEWQQTGMPASHGKFIYHPVCKSCRRDFVATRPPKRQRERKDIDD